MSSTVNVSDLFGSPSLNGTYATKPINQLTHSKDQLYEPFNSVYGEATDKELPLEVKEYLLQIKSYSDALSSALVSLMTKAGGASGQAAQTTQPAAENGRVSATTDEDGGAQPTRAATGNRKANEARAVEDDRRDDRTSQAADNRQTREKARAEQAANADKRASDRERAAQDRKAADARTERDRAAADAREAQRRRAADELAARDNEGSDTDATQERETDDVRTTQDSRAAEELTARAEETVDEARIAEADAARAETDNANIDEVKDSLRNLVDSYNALLEFSGDYGKDPGFEKLHNRLTSLMDSYGGTLSEAGISVTGNGTLALDESRIDQSIADGRMAELFSRDESNRASFTRGLGALSEKGRSEPFAYMNDEQPHKSGGDKTGREYLKMMDTYATKGMMFDTKQ